MFKARDLTIHLMESKKNKKQGNPGSVGHGFMVPLPVVCEVYGQSNLSRFFQRLGVITTSLCLLQDTMSDIGYKLG
jgi:hypothetical protein